MKDRVWILIATISASSMAFISQSSLNVALPAIQRSLGATGADLLWIVNVFQLLLGALILLGGALGDIVGRRRIYGIGIAVFTAASVACGLAPSVPFLIVARAVQGLGGALMVPGSLAIIAATFDGSTRGTAIGTWSSFTTMTSILGPLLGGAFVDAGFWRGVFYMNVPLGIAALALVIWKVPESRNPDSSGHLDTVGAGLATLGLGGIVYGATEIGRRGLGDRLSLLLAGTVVVGIVAMVVFAWWERRAREPMVPMRLFANRTFSGTNLLTLLLYGALGGALFFLPLNLVQVQGYTGLQAGLAFLPFSILLVVMSPGVGRLADRVGPRRFLVMGPAITGIGFALLAWPGITPGFGQFWTTYFPGATVLGLGMGFTVAPLTATVMGCVSSSLAGTASGINNAISRASGVLATAIMGGLALIIFRSSLAESLAALDLPPDAVSALLAQAGELAETPIPESLGAAGRAAAQRAVDSSFVAVFRRMMIIGAALAWASSVFAAVLVEPLSVRRGTGAG